MKKISLMLFACLLSLSIFANNEIILTGGIQDNQPTVNNVLSDALTTLSSGGTITIKGNITITNTSITIPENIELNFFNGNRIDVTSTGSLIIEGSIKSGLNQIFSGAGSFSGTPKNVYVFPEWFGAIGNGTANDKYAINNALKLSSQIRWPNTYYSDEDVVINTPGFNVYKLKLKNTTLVIDATGKEFRQNTIKGLSIVNDTLVAGSIGLYLKRGGSPTKIRDLLIHDIHIKNTDKAVYGNAHNAFHTLGTVTLTNSTLADNNYSVYFDENDDPSEPYNSINDITISNNVFYSLIKDCYFKSADGVLISNNTFFGNSANKSVSIHLGTNLSDQIKIHGNQIFEAQEEGILVENAKSFQIINNNIVASVNLVKFASKIKVNIQAIPAEATITGNVIRKATKHGIEIIDGTDSQVLTQSVFVDNNVIYTQAYGIVEGKDLAAEPHYGVTIDGKYIYVNGENHALKEQRDASDDAYYTEISNWYVIDGIEKKNNFSKTNSNNVTYKTITFNGTVEEDLISFVGTNERYSFLLKVHCWLGGRDNLHNANSATYLLLVSRALSGADTTGEEVAVIKELGMAKFASNPDSWIPLSWPAFHFDLTDNTLSVKHKKNQTLTNTSFTFEIIKIGDGSLK
jgi:hypothetical protein